VTLGELASADDPSSPLAGIQLWLNGALGLTMVQARGDEMLDRNCTPEPWRTSIRQAMTHRYSTLWPGQDVELPRIEWIEHGAQTIGGPYTHVIMIAHDNTMSEILAVTVTYGGTVHEHWCVREGHLCPADRHIDQNYATRNQVYDWRAPTITSTRLPGRWTVPPDYDDKNRLTPVRNAE
jgi:hypothetical protein